MRHYYKAVLDVGEGLMKEEDFRRRLRRVESAVAWKYEGLKVMIKENFGKREEERYLNED